jgi:cytidylate kinase
MAVITISRQFGAGGATLGRQLAERMGYIFVSGEIIKMVAKKAHVSPEWVTSVEREAGGRLQKFITTLVPRGLVDRILDDQRGYIDEEIYVDLLGDIVTTIADEGNCVILGRGGQFFLQERPETFHVLLVAEAPYRIRFMEERYNLTHAEAVQTIEAEDKRRSNLYRKIGRADYDRPEHYHLTFNMSRTSMDTAVAVIHNLVTENGGPLAKSL